MPDKRIKGKFYPLQNSEWVKAVKELTKSQLAILYYLRSLDPYGDGVKIRASKVAEELEISKRAVNAAIAVLIQKEFIDFGDAEYSVKLFSKATVTDTEPSQRWEENFPPGKKNSHQRTEFPTREENFPPGNTISHPSPVSQSQTETKTPKTNKTYKTFKDSLSESEKESFEEFGKKKANELPNPPTLTQKWIEKHWEELKGEWYKETGNTPPVTTQQWENHPKKDEWLAELEKFQNPGQFYMPSDRLDEERRDFYEWAYDNKILSWRKDK